MIKLIVGLGNPGAEYANTRHNVGAWFVDAIAAAHNATFKKEKKFFGDLAKVNFASDECYLLKPATFMNDSGQSVQAIAHFYKIKPEEILVAHDEIDFPIGQVRIKKGGGHGGHNGLRDIMERLSTADFFRLRIGVSHPGHKDRVSSHVLGAPSKKDKAAIDDSIIEALRILPDLVAGETDKVMRELH